MPKSDMATATVAISVAPSADSASLSNQHQSIITRSINQWSSSPSSSGVKKFIRFWLPPVPKKLRLFKILVQFLFAFKTTENNCLHLVCNAAVFFYFTSRAYHSVSLRFYELLYNIARHFQRRSQEFDLGGYKLHDIEFVLVKETKQPHKNLR